LEALQERYDHEQSIEKRENTQALTRQEQQFNQENRAQERQLAYELDLIDRELRNQRDAWVFHDEQRRENEEQAMNQLIIEHGHKLQTMYEDSEWRLSQLPPVFKHYGYESAKSFGKGWEEGLKDYPIVISGPATDGGAGPKRHQAGVWNVPRNELAFLDRGEMVVPAGPAQAIREGGLGGITIGELHVHGNYTPFLARKVAREVAEQLGPMINQRSR
jgi:hypothetical protein